MRIVAHSQVPATQSPYLHLGYCSAQFNPNMGVLGTGTIITIVSVLIGAAILLPRVRHLRKARYLVAAGAAIALLSGVLVSVSLAHRLGRWGSKPGHITWGRIYGLNENLRRREAAGEPIPTLTTDLPLTLNGPLDEWSRAMQIRTRERDGQIEHYVVSAGRDGIFDTKDDIFDPNTFWGRDKR
ncbi:MAG TPA: hypothetical protein VGP72_17905 [Planctomycetota bacterium]|jgi:hypothetical protein